MKTELIKKLDMWPAKEFKKICVPMCNKKSDEDDDNGRVLESTVEFLCLTEDKNFGENMLQLEFLIPYVWVPNDKLEKPSFGWFRKDGNRVLSNSFNPVYSWNELVIGFALTDSKKFV